MRYSKCLPFLIAAVVIFSSCKTSTNKSDSNVATSDTAMIDGHPAWILQGNIYEVNVRQYTPEGTFNAFGSQLQRLKDMGVQTLWFMPINPISKVDRKGALGSYYAVANYTAINPEYGTMDDWKALVKKCHDMGFKVIIDWVPNHSGADNYWLDKHPDFYMRDSTGKAMYAYDWSDTRKLNYANAELADTMINAMKYWITNSDIDGFRCDVAGEVPDTFWKRCISELRGMKNIFMLAEGNKASLQEDGFDATYPWSEFAMMKMIANGQRPAFALDSVVNMVDSTFPKHSLLMYFTSNHDENSWNKADYGTMPGEIHAPFAVLTQTMEHSVPLIYSGQEEPYLDSISFFYKDTIKFGKYARAPFYKTLLDLRKSTPALSGIADFIRLHSDNDKSVYAYERINGNSKVLVVLNFSSVPVNFHLSNADIQGNVEDVFANKQLTLKNDEAFSLPAWGYGVYKY